MPPVVVGRILRRMAVTVDAAEVLEETAALMAYAQRSGGFTAGGGGSDTGTFTANTTPTVARATKVCTRNAGIVASDFAAAPDDKQNELVTIAALRSAIELENSTPTVDDVRIENWRQQLREYVGRFDDQGGGGDDEPPSGELKAAWSFPGREECHTPGSELPYPSTYAPDGRNFRW